MKNCCKCGCHKFVVLIYILSVVALAGYVSVVWFGASAFLGRSADQLFQHLVILMLLGVSKKGMCKCCCGDSSCESCKVSEKN
jgi:hypothetical protein